MSGKRHKLPTKRGWASEDPTPNYDVTQFVNEGAADRFGTICKSRSFIMEKGFHHPNDFFRKNIAAKGWQALCQPPHPAAMSVVREFYANLASNVVKKVRVRGVLVDFSAESVTPRIPVRPDWRIRTGFRSARLRTGTLYLIFFFFKTDLVPVGYGPHL